MLGKNAYQVVQYEAAMAKTSTTIYAGDYMRDACLKTRQWWWGVTCLPTEEEYPNTTFMVDR